MINTSSNLGEYREAINNLENNYLPKSGGTMTGIITRSGYLARSGSKENILALLSGTDVTHGAGLWLAGNDYSGTVPAGAFRLQGYNPSTQKYANLTGKPDGTLTWNGSNVIVDGGIISKSLTSSSSVLAKKATDDKSLIFYSGTDASRGATFGGYGINYETYGGRFYAKATDGTNEYFFYCRPDGKMTWCGNEIRFVKSTYSSGATWYRIWSDGWIEQGGKYTGTSGTCWSATITFPKVFSNTNYNVSVTSTGLAGDMWGEHGENVESITTSSFKYYFYTGASGDGTTGFYWTACGY